jgi:hypothetical protein
LPGVLVSRMKSIASSIGLPGLTLLFSAP